MIHCLHYATSRAARCHPSCIRGQRSVILCASSQLMHSLRNMTKVGSSLEVVVSVENVVLQIINWFEIENVSFSVLQ